MASALVRAPSVTVASVLAGTALLAAALLAVLQPAVLGLAAPRPGLALGLAVLGVGLAFASSRLARFDVAEPAAAPSGRTRVLVLYRRRSCPPCEEAKAQLGPLAAHGVEVREVDVDAPGEEAARAAFGDWVPVGVVDGEVAFRLAADVPRVRALLGLPPP